VNSELEFHAAEMRSRRAASSKRIPNPNYHRRSPLPRKYPEAHGKRNTLTYKSYAAMMARCYNPRHTAYKYYGGKGIGVFQRWIDSFSTFVGDIGERPSARHTLDRYPDNKGNYEPGNVRWATQKQQVRNRENTLRVKFGEEERLLCELAELHGLSSDVVIGRIKRGWSVDQALGVAPGPSCQREVIQPLKPLKDAPHDKLRRIEFIKVHLRKGEKCAAIAQLLGVTRQYVSLLCIEFGIAIKRGRPKKPDQPQSIVVNN